MVCHQRPCIVAQHSTTGRPKTLPAATVFPSDYTSFGLHNASILGNLCLPVVATMKLDPIHKVCAKHHSACPNDCGCRVILMTPVSHRCSFGLSTAAT